MPILRADPASPGLQARPAAWKRDCARTRSSSPRRAIHTWENRRSSKTRTGPCAVSSSSSPTRVRAWPAKVREILRNAGNEEHRIAVFKPKLGHVRRRSAPRRYSSQWVRPPRRHGKRYSRAPAGPRPGPSCSCGRRMRAIRPPLAGIAHTSAFSNHSRPSLCLSSKPGKNLEARSAEMLRNVFQLDRVAQIRLVGAVPSRIAVL